MNELSRPVVSGLLRAADLIAILLAGLIAYLVRFGELGLPNSYLLVVIIAGLLAANVFHMADLYRFGQLTRHLFQARKMFLAWSLVTLLLLTIGFLAKTSEEYSRVWVGLFYVFGYVTLAVLRFAVKQQIGRWQRAGRLVRRIAVIGAGEHGQRLIRHLAVRGESGIKIVGIFDDRRTRVPGEIEGFQVRGGVDDLLAQVRDGKIDQIIVALPWSAEARVFQVMSKLRTVPIDVRLSPEPVVYRIPNHGFSDVGGVSMLNVLEKPLSNWDQVVKELEDRVIATLILFFIAPLLLTIAVLIKLDSRGPVLFRQTRFGFNKEKIVVYKFRTMYHNGVSDRAVPQAQKEDPRITRVGRFLRRASLDELPQFVNVVQGTMSIVGPRPHATVHDEEFATMMDQYMVRHNVKPGITGWAQVNGYRGEIEDQRDLIMRVQHDLYYIDNWSLWFDLKIILVTIFRGFVHEKAY